MVAAGNISAVQEVRAALVTRQARLQAAVISTQAALDATTTRISQLDLALASALTADQEAALFLALVKAGT